MDTKKLLLSTLAGTVVSFLLGFLFYALLLENFFEANVGTAQNVAKANPSLLLIFLAQLCQSLLLAYIFLRWAGIKTFATGAQAGAIIGLLMALTYDLMLLGTSNVSTPIATVVDIVVMTIMMAITGGIIGLVLGKMDDKT